MPYGCADCSEVQQVVGSGSYLYAKRAGLASLHAAFSKKIKFIWFDLCQKIDSNQYVRFDSTVRPTFSYYGCQPFGFDPDSPGFDLWSPGSGFSASISGLLNKLEQKSVVSNKIQKQTVIKYPAMFKSDNFDHHQWPTCLSIFHTVRNAIDVLAVTTYQYR